MGYVVCTSKLKHIGEITLDWLYLRYLFKYVADWDLGS